MSLTWQERSKLRDDYSNLCDNLTDLVKGYRTTAWAYVYDTKVEFGFRIQPKKDKVTGCDTDYKGSVKYTGALNVSRMAQMADSVLAEFLLFLVAEDRLVTPKQLEAKLESKVFEVVGLVSKYVSSTRPDIMELVAFLFPDESNQEAYNNNYGYSVSGTIKKRGYRKKGYARLYFHSDCTRMCAGRIECKFPSVLSIVSLEDFAKDLGRLIIAGTDSLIIDWKYNKK